MFSGIVEAVGTVRAVRPLGRGRAVLIESPLPVGAAGEAGVGAERREAVGLGDSVAVQGACLTVDAVDPPHRFSVSVGQETVAHRQAAEGGAGDRVHLERALRLSDRLDGHLVSGHVDGVGRVLRAERSAESVVIRVLAPPELGRYIAEKGSIAVDGVSLTVNEVRDEAGGAAFRVNIVPFTADATLLGGLAAGAAVNLEVDLLSRYVERLLGGAPGGGLTAERLRELGYGGRRGRR